MNALRGRASRLAMVGALFGMVAALAAPHLGDVTAGSVDTDPTETTTPADRTGGPETSVVEAGPTATTEAEPTPTTEAEPTATTGVDDTAPESTVDDTDTTEAVVESTTPEPTGPFPTVVPDTKPDTAAETTEPDGTVGPAGPGDTYDVTVEGVCSATYELSIHVVNLSTADARVSVGPDSVDLLALETHDFPWPMTRDDPPTPDPAPKWDAVRLDTMEIFENGTLTIPADCPPVDVPSEPQNLATTSTDGEVHLAWDAPASDGGSPITSYHIDYQPGATGDWLPLADLPADATSYDATALTNGTTYRFLVIAINDNGSGVPAEGKDTPNVIAAAPTGLTVAPTGRGRLLVSWTAPTSGAPFSGYAIERSLDNVSWTPLTEVGGDTTSFLDIGLARPQRYYYRVTAMNSLGLGLTSAVASGVPFDVPTAPRSLTAAPTNVSGQIRLTWVTPLSNGGSPVTDYVVQRLSGATWVTYNDGVNVNTSFVVGGLSNGVRYYFRVLARSAIGQSPPSNVANAIPRTKPTAPRSLTAAATGVAGQVRLAWLTPLSSGGSAITDYIIQRSPNGSTSWTTIPDGVNVNRSYTVTGLVTGTRYYFRVLAKNAAGNSPSSNIASAVPTRVLTAPRSLTASPTNRSGQVRLTWLAPLSNGGAAIADYIIQRSPNGSTGWTTIPDGVNVNTAYTVTGLSNGVRYYFRVFARTSRATSPRSNIANAVPRIVPTAPRSPTAAPNNLSGQIRLTWLAPSSNGGSAVTDYIIQRSPNGTSSWVTINDGVSTATSRVVTGLTNGVRYYFRVFARNAAGNSPASAVVSAVPRTVPGTPSFVQVEAFSWGFELEWGNPVSTGGSPITGFLIQAFDGEVWVNLFTAQPTTRILTINAPGEGCGAFRIATLNAAGRSAFLGPVVDCWP